MISRRSFIKNSSITALGIGLSGFKFKDAVTSAPAFKSQRPPVNERKFISESIEAEIVKIKNSITDEELGWLFENCFPNTLDTTVRFEETNGKPDTFVITGDIPAMWLRDSSAQVWPYIPFTKDDRKLKELIRGVIFRQTKCILIDPYANAFNYGSTGSEWDKDFTDMKPELHERKWEIDSLCYPVRLAHGYWKTTGDASCFDLDWVNAVKLILKTFHEQQRLNGPGPYTFRRLTTTPNDTLPLNGYGNPTKPNGLIHSMFRPSDDACIFPMLIPSNLFAAVSLKQLAEIFENEMKDRAFASECEEFSDLIFEKVKEFAIADNAGYLNIYALEIDGFGNRLFMDDANVPSLLSLPYLGCVPVSDEHYLRTRNFVLSEDNPYYHKGKAAEGIGGPHIGKDMIWALSIVMRALTSGDDMEITDCLKTLKATHAGTGFMHESFHIDNPNKFTRSWFAWANTLFGEMILKICQERKELLLKKI